MTAAVPQSTAGSNEEFAQDARSRDNTSWSVVRESGVKKAVLRGIKVDSSCKLTYGGISTCPSPSTRSCAAHGAPQLTATYTAPVVLIRLQKHTGSNNDTLVFDFLLPCRFCNRCDSSRNHYAAMVRFHLFRDIRLVTRERLVQFNALGTSLAYLGRYVSSLSTLIGPEDDMQLVRSIVVRAGQFENLNELDYGPVERRLVDQDLLSSLKTVSTLRIRTREHLDSLESYTQIIRPFRRTRTLAFHGEDDISDSITAITRSSEALALSEVTQLELRLKHCPHLIDAIAQCLRTDILPSLHTLALGTTCQRTWVAFSAELNAREGAWQDLSLATYAKCKCTAISNTANNILPTPRITDLLPPCPNLRRLRLHAARNSIRTVSMMLAKYETHERLDEVNDTLDLTYGPSGAKMALHDWKALYRYLSLHQWKSLKRSTMTVITDLSPDHGLVQSVCDVFQGSSSPV